MDRAAMTAPLPDAEATGDFLRRFRPQGWLNLVAIHPETGVVEGITRPMPEGLDDLLAFVRARNGKHNLYFTVNEPRPDEPDRKLSKDDIGRLVGVFVDADPRKDAALDTERARILAQTDDWLGDFAFPPTFAIDSGAGNQAFWLFAAPIDATKDSATAAEALGRGLAKKLGTDAVQNIDRIPDDIKERYPTAFEVDATWLIAAAARRQKWIDMGQSLNLYVAEPSGRKLSDLYTEAWKSGLKTTYYLRSRGATQNEKSTIDINRRGVQPRWMRARSASAEITIQRDTPPAPAAAAPAAPSTLSAPVAPAAPAAPATPPASAPIQLTPHLLNGNGHDSSGDEFICEACQ